MANTDDGREPTQEKRLIGPELVGYSETHNIKVEPKESAEDATHRRWKDRLVTKFFLGAVALAFVGGFVMLWIGDSELKKLGLSAIMAIVGAGISKALAGK